MFFQLEDFSAEIGRQRELFFLDFFGDVGEREFGGGKYRKLAGCNWVREYMVVGIDEFQDLCGRDRHIVPVMV